MDHGLNASTFAARVTAGTLADLHAAVTSAIGTLKGPLHGGANHDVMVMLRTIGEVEKAAEFVRMELLQKKKIPGFGHRVYRTIDPRALHLRSLSEKLGKAVGQEKWFQMSAVIEKTCKELKNLNPNVDFYAASVYFMLGFEMDLFTPIFACSRAPGWIAHVLEQNSCSGCANSPACVAFCETVTVKDAVVDAIRYVSSPDAPNNLAVIEYDKCIGCALCAEVCPWEAITMYNFEEAWDVAPEVTL